MDRATSKCNAAKSAMKHPSDMPTTEIRTRVLVICGSNAIRVRLSVFRIEQRKAGRGGGNDPQLSVFH